MPARFSKLCSFPANWEDDIKNIAKDKKISLNDLICDAVFDLMKKEIITESEEIGGEIDSESKLRLGNILQ